MKRILVTILVCFGAATAIFVIGKSIYNEMEIRNEKMELTQTELAQAELIAWHKGYEYGRFETILKFQEMLPESTFVELAAAEQDGLSARELRYLKVIPKVERRVLIP